MFKFFESFTEFFAMIKIALSPIIIFTGIGLVSYFSMAQPLGIIIGIGFTILGIAIGVWLAVRIHKKYGAVEFNSGMSDSPKRDKKKKE